MVAIKVGSLGAAAGLEVGGALGMVGLERPLSPSSR